MTTNLNSQLIRPDMMQTGSGMYQTPGMVGGGVVMPVDNGYGLNDVANLFIHQQVSDLD